MSGVSTLTILESVGLDCDGPYVTDFKAGLLEDVLCGSAFDDGSEAAIRLGF